MPWKGKRETTSFPPGFLVTDKTVQFIINEGHRLNFGDPSKPEKPPGAGQLQYTTKPEDPDSWLGIGLSGGGSWSSSNNGVSSLADLPPLEIGTELRVRFLGAVRDAEFRPNSNFPGHIWDINNVLIMGVEEHPCP